LRQFICQSCSPHYQYAVSNAHGLCFIYTDYNIFLPVMSSIFPKLHAQIQNVFTKFISNLQY
jgi:hypothetical protein